ncbi:GntR family transcriptional regulator [Halalkalibacter sp. AB-rgal2]|uniref:GntR family transcriptional regulator n=1 Tax=Halalkalibacter sp. AB-rgal2 TaxID=3242695 RepID=UPI00359D2D27
MQPLEDKAFDFLKERLINGEYMPGTLLSENELAKTLAMSRTPVRAAISQLEREGFLETVKNRGILVRDISYKEFLEIFEVIFSFQHYQFYYQEPEDLHIDVQQLNYHLKEQYTCTSNEDYLGYTKHSLSFLHTMISGTNNKEMLKVIDGFFDKIIRFAIVNYIRTPHQSHYSANETNQQLVDALEKGDFNQIKQLLHTYYERVKARFG